MKIDLSFVPQELQYALTELLAEMNLKTKRSFTLKTIHSNFCSVSFSDNELTIHYEEKKFLFRAFRKFCRTGECLPTPKKSVRRFAIMIDLSRNAVKNIDSIKKLLRLCALFGYNELWLYMEDVYTIESEPSFGRMRGRYSREELQEIASYAKYFDIEIIQDALP